MKNIVRILALFSAVAAMSCSSEGSSVATTEDLEIKQFDFQSLEFSDVELDGDTHTINVRVIYDTDLKNLVAIFKVSDNASVLVDGVEQVSGQTSNDFSMPVTYTLESDEGQIAEWVVKVEHLKEQPIVSKFANVSSNGGIAVHSSGKVYSSSESNLIYEISESGLAKNFVSGDPNVTRVTMLIFDSNEDFLYASNTPTNQLGWITRISLTGQSEVFATGFALPTGLAFDDQENLYVADQNNTIWKVDAAGKKSVFVQSSTFNRPHGMAWAKDNLYVASAHDGNIYKISTTGQPSVDFHAKVNGLSQQWAAGYMMYANNNLYITNGDNNIHQVSLGGEVSVYAGTGATGSKNGPSSYAQFSAPNGIGASPSGDSFFVGEYNNSSIRRITN